MVLTLLTPPAVLPVAVAEAQTHARVDGDDALLGLLIASATAALDGPSGELGRCLLAQNWRQTEPRFPCDGIRLRLPPTISVDAITYRDTTGAWVTLAPADYTVLGLGSLSHATVIPAPGKSWPATYAAEDAVRVTFTAGFGDEAADVPADLRLLILQRVAAAYGVREAVWTGTAPARTVDEFAAVVDRWRIPDWT